MMTDVLILLYLLLCIWVHLCMLIASKQREKIRDIVFKHKDWKYYNEKMKEITLQKHIWYVFTFRNPRKLYTLP